jgi:cell division protein FtsB
MLQLLMNTREWLLASRHKLATMGVALVAAVVGYPVIFGANGLLVYHQKRAESQQLQQQIITLEEQNRAMEQQIHSLKYDPKAIEKEARERLRYARKGEKVYTLPAPARQHSSQQAVERK